MSTALITHPDCAKHITPGGHPEQVARLRAVTAALETEAFQDLVRVEAPEAPEAALLRAHSAEHVAAVEASANAGRVHSFDADTFAGPDTARAARLAAGAVITAVDMVLGGEVGNAFCAVRPPGHHAERNRVMGFCFYNSAAVGAFHAIEAHGLSKVAVVDFDVHHGNGTQDIFESDPRTFYVSIHQSPLYPGTGRPEERGVGNIVNAILPPHADGAAFRTALTQEAIPALEAFAPELVILSAGFDAHWRDPLAQLELTEADFAFAAEALCAAARRSPAAGRVVSTLEGGYDLQALGASAAAHVAALMAEGAR